MGRYITSDPIGLEGGLNTYGYAYQNPLYWIDPFGLSSENYWGGLGSDAIPIPLGCDNSGSDIDIRFDLTPVDNTIDPNKIKEILAGGGDPVDQRKLIDDLVSQGWGAGKLGRSGKQARLREMMNDPKASSADRGWLRNDARHIRTGNKSGLRIPRNGKKSPGRKSADKGYELAHPHNSPASRGNSYSGSKLKNHADHKVETRLHQRRY